MAKKNLPAKKQGNGDVPAYFEGMGDMGTESIDSTDISIPRIKICQKMSTVHDDAQMKDGSIYDSVSKEVIPTPFEFVVVLHWKSMVWFSKDNKFIASCQIDPITKKEVWFGNDIDKIQNDDDLYAQGMNTHNYFLLPIDALNNAVQNGDFPLPMIYSAASAAIKHARNLNGHIRMNGGKGIPIFGQVVQMETVEDKFQAGKAFMPRFKFGDVVNKQQAQFLAKYHTECKKLQAQAGADEPQHGNTDFPPKDDDEDIEVPSSKKKKKNLF